MTSRTPEQVHESHVAAFVRQDLDALAANFADDAVFILHRGVQRGREGVKAGFAKIFDELAGADYNLKSQTWGDEILVLEWEAETKTSRAQCGMDVFIFRGGQIRAEVVRYDLVTKS